MEIKELLAKQRAFFKSGATLDVDYRISHLRKLYKAIQDNEKEIYEALYKDLGKSETEGFMCEVGMVYTEISYMLKHVRRFSKRKSVYTPLAQFASNSFIETVPYGNTLIMSPWNYPFMLTMEPLVDAIAAGNTAILKPSAYSGNTSLVIEKIIKEVFSEEYVAVVRGGREENKELLDQKFDFIFFTGGQNVGKEVLRKSADNLTPVVLELGGKSPCIVDRSADLKLSAKRIVFGKFLNCDQTCVAPDYILCDKEVVSEFTKELIKEIKKQFGDSPLNNKDYGKIINSKHFNRLIGLINKDKLTYGGNFNIETNQIEPTILSDITEDDLIMKEEIFGPLLPIMTYEDFDTVVAELKDKPKPLALYIFSKDKKHINRVMKELSYGGGCINDVIIHLATSEMGFGGVGESGMGTYHGKFGFEAFSHKKSIVDKKCWLDLPMRYQPYTNGLYKKLLRIFLS
ncbi:MAG: aldehyde dehydrogenase [Erysipelotrichaceae bacterium]|nr:aldehyde dehydrogenase [Erysipelotrichaceae bacterium]